MSTVEFSRPQATADALGALAADRHRFVSKRVLLSGDPSILASNNGETAFLTALRLMPRICRNVEVSLPPECAELRRAATTIVANMHDACVIHDAPPPAGGSFDAILFIGRASPSDGAYVLVGSDGWIARVSAEGPLPPPEDSTNPIGAFAAACWGVAEVFKRLIALKPTRGKPADRGSFNTFSLNAHDPVQGPAIPQLTRPMLLVGAGAIGSAVANLLAMLPVSGPLIIVDNQAFSEENWGTSIVLGKNDYGRPKAEVLARVLASNVQAIPFVGRVEDLSTRLMDTNMAPPEIVLSGVDNIDARHRIQSMWPHVVFDGAIGDFPVQVSCHYGDGRFGCLECLFVDQPGRDSVAFAAECTGLAPHRVQDANSLVSEADVSAARPQSRSWLAARVGKPVCSVVSEATAAAISTEHLPDQFRPSVPFVAGLSAALMVASLVRLTVGAPLILEPAYQFDALTGPARGMMFPLDAKPDCICVARQQNIRLHRADLRPFDPALLDRDRS